MGTNAEDVSQNNVTRRENTHDRMVYFYQVRIWVLIFQIEN